MAHAILVSTPFGPFTTPSLGLSLLKSVAEMQGHQVSIDYSNIRFANRIGLEIYNGLSMGYPTNTSLAAEFLFSSYFNGDDKYLVEDYVSREIDSKANCPPLDSVFSADLTSSEQYERFAQEYRELFEIVPEWLESEVAHLASHSADVYGFTSMFQQNFASLTIARELKKKRPNSLVIFGGPNCESPMGDALLAKFEFIDAVCSGEGEYAFVSFLEEVDRGRLAGGHENICVRGKPTNLTTSTKRVKVELDALPFVDYDDYFSQLTCIRDREQVRPRVLLETSRGCWWGEKSHCTFCGLNGSSMAFRAKSAGRAFSEIHHLSMKYPDSPISVVDNIIDYRYFDTLLPKLHSANINVDLFYETKANLKRQQLKLMNRAGINRIQPGIESLSTSVLKTMKKGVRAIQNISLLKWCAEEGIRPEWNILWGFPEEDPNEYNLMDDLMRYLTHLTPPVSSSRIRLDRYSPLYEDKTTPNVQDVRPYSAYSEIYRLPVEDAVKFAYYFEFDYVDGRKPSIYTASFNSTIKDWMRMHNESYLIYFSNDQNTIICDSRSIGSPTNYRLPFYAASILSMLEVPVPVRDVLNRFDRDDVVFDWLLTNGIVIELDGYFFNIAIELSAAQNGYRGFLAFLTDMQRGEEAEGDSMLTLNVETCPEAASS